MSDGRYWRALWPRRRSRKLEGSGDLLRHFPDLDPAFVPLYQACRAATMTSVERLYALYKSVEYVVRADIPGDFVECGVWRGGSVMMMALALQTFGGAGRRLYCFDTFEGMPPPGGRDIRHETGETAAELLANDASGGDGGFHARAPLEEVERNIAATGYPAELVTYCQGRVEETLPASAPERVALVRLDTDWYQSTKHELVCLYPRLSAGGVLIIDDYGFFRGAREATDEYFTESGNPILLHRIDNTGRIGIKAAGPLTG